MAGGIDFNRGKFKELVLLFAHEAARTGDEGFGMVKLNKLLYHADFEAFRRFGRPITGASYERQEFGPVARPLPLVLDELAAAGRLSWELIARGDHTAKVPGLTDDPNAAPDLSQFVDQERDQIRETLRALATYGGKSVSHWSHEESAGWRMVAEDGREIEYETAFFSTKPIPPEDVVRAQDYLRERGLIKNAS
ncbi:MAG: hypothetical protein QOJ22_1010 [Thermoleophilaceae bacterium]|jgi:uncharacterized phage-associated protein|nr:hypothetical protein [Thermoleophilaceae bacterium]